MEKEQVLKEAVNVKTENQPQQQQQLLLQNQSVRFADEFEIAKNIVRAGALTQLKEASFDYELHELLTNMRAVQLLKDKAKLALRYEQKELQDLLHEYKVAQTKEERDQIYERIKAKNAVIDQHLKTIKQTEADFAKYLKFANAHFDREEDMIHSYVRSLNAPEPFKFLLRLFYDTGHMMKIAAFHLSSIKIRNNAYERAYLSDVAEAYKTKNIEKMKQLAEKTIADDTKVRTATQNEETLFENDTRDEIMKALQALKEAHQKLEKALKSKFTTLDEAESMIQAKKQELSQDQEPPAPAV